MIVGILWTARKARDQVIRAGGGCTAVDTETVALPPLRGGCAEAENRFFASCKLPEDLQAPPVGDGTTQAAGDQVVAEHPRVRNVQELPSRLRIEVRTHCTELASQLRRLGSRCEHATCGVRAWQESPQHAYVTTGNPGRRWHDQRNSEASDPDHI